MSPTPPDASSNHEATPSLSPADREALQALCARGVVFDAHVDALGRAVDLGDDLGQRGRGHFDLVRAREGGLAAWVSVLWVDPELYLAYPYARAVDMLHAAHNLARRHPDRYRLVGNSEELAVAREEDVIAGLVGIEGGHAIEGSLAKLEWFFRHGLRVMTLVWNNHLPWIRSCQSGATADVPSGINEFGREVIQFMNFAGIVVDVSHAGERAFYDSLEASSMPVIASHSGCKALHDHPRNLTDDQLRAIAAKGGVCGIVFHPGFLDEKARAEEARVRESPAYRANKQDTNATPAERFLRGQELMQRDAAPLSAERLVDHIEHACEVAGVEHVAIGSDFDGIERGPQGVEDASRYPYLAELLLRRGFQLDYIERILGGNMRRVFASVTGIGMAAYTAEIEPLPAEPGRRPPAPALHK